MPDVNGAPVDVARSVVVWGNCQAAPIAALLSGPLAEHGLSVMTVPPVFEIDAAGLERVRAQLATAALLITQPIRDEYRIPGCGSGSRPASFARISSQWAGMMLTKTFAAIACRSRDLGSVNERVTSAAPFDTGTGGA